MPSRRGGGVAKYKSWRTEEGLTCIKGWAREGLTNEKIAQKIGINVDTLYEWQKKFSDISDALKKNKEIIDLGVEESLLDKCNGYIVELKKPFKVRRIKYENGRKVEEYEEIVYGTEETYITADTTAQIFWLKNRKPGTWRDRREFTEDVQEVNNSFIEALSSSAKEVWPDEDDETE